MEELWDVCAYLQMVWRIPTRYRAAELPAGIKELPAGIKEFEDKILDQLPGLKAEQPPISFGKKPEMSPVEKLFKPNDPQVLYTHASLCHKRL